MSRKDAGINPELIAVITGGKQQVDEVPTAAKLPGNAARLVAKRIKKVAPIYKPNKQLLKCIVHAMRLHICI
ncbi:hypothetical protein [Paenibacillus sp. GCM10027626]|uniref:hypothetical protein n=1 Tax=Paenibacillus sp. GCM10027626 TaxID=3273411 RepID=UPI003639EA87